MNNSDKDKTSFNNFYLSNISSDSQKKDIIDEVNDDSGSSLDKEQERIKNRYINKDKLNLENKDGEYQAKHIGSNNKYKDKINVYDSRPKGSSVDNKYKDKVDIYKVNSKGISDDNNKNIKTNQSIKDKNKETTIVSSVSSKSNEHISKKDVDPKKEFVAPKNVESKVLSSKGVSSEKTELNDKPKKRQSKYVGIITRKDVSNLSDSDKEKRLNELEEEILLGLDVKLERELRNLRAINLDNNDIINFLDHTNPISQEEIKEKIEKLEELLKKIQNFIEQVEILKNNYRFEDIINLKEFKDQNIISDIVEYRDILGTYDERSKDFSEKYKMLDNFISLYKEVYASEEILKYNVSVENERLKITEDRDLKYNKFQDDIKNVEQLDREFKIVIDKQNQYLDVLSGRISRIDSRMEPRYRLDGVNNILLSTLMYITVMSNMAFRNRTVQGAASVLATRRFLRNLQRNRPRLVYTETVTYEAEDFTNELYNHLDDVEMLSSMVNSTLDEIRVMRDEFREEFMGKVPGYEEVEEKLNEVETSILETQKRLELTQNNLNRNLDVNERKLVRVRDMNRQAA